MKNFSKLLKSLLWISVVFAGVLLTSGCSNQIVEETKYTVNYHSLRGTAPSEISVTSGTVLTADELPALYEEGCNFNGWYDGDVKAEADKYKVTRNVTLEASWTKIRTDSADENGSDSIYEVEHYFQRLNGTGYSLVENDTQTLTGKSGEQTEAKALDVTGFTAKKIDQQTIASDGSTVIQVYYDRNTVVITFDTDGGNEIASLSGFYGAEVAAPENPVREGFEFNNWEPAIPSKFTDSITVKAIWKGNSTNVDFVINQSDISVTVERTCVTASEGYSDYLWTVNGNFSDEISNQFYVPCTPGVYEVNVSAQKGGTAYSASVTITVTSTNTDNDFVKVEGTTVTKNTAEKNQYFTYFADGYSKTIPDFYICAHEVTQKEYKDVMEVNPSANSVEDTDIQSLLPVENVSWYMAIAYCNARSVAEGLSPCYKVGDKTEIWKSIPASDDEEWDAATCDISMNGYRLPTEAEWEYAARGGNLGLKVEQYSYSGSNTVDTAAWYASNSSNKSHENSLKTANRLGIFDMSGNVAEWCNDSYSKEVSSSDSSGINKVYRGGSYSDSADSCKISCRNSCVPYIKNGSTGIRLVRSSL